ncbi:MAG: thiamine diphosphokinase [Anaeroplasmataceae bacterium]
MKVYVVLANNVDLTKYDFKNSFVIGVDRGSLILTNNNINIDIAVGDFDSVNETELIKIKSFAKKFIQLDPIKDVSDTYYALDLAYNISSDVTILGGITGNRIEHLFANMILFTKYPKLVIEDNYSNIYLISKTEDYIYKENYKFISFFAINDSVISLKKFKYELEHYNLKVFDPLCLSNEYNINSKLTLHKGLLIAILSKDDSLN